MFSRGAEGCSTSLRANVLAPFALTPRIICKYNVALARQILIKVLIIPICFSIWRVAERRENCRKRRLPQSRNIEVSGNVDLWDAFKNNFLNPVSRPLKLACNLRVEW